MSRQPGRNGCRHAEAVDPLPQKARQREPFAAVILGLTVPGGMGGKEAAHRIRSLDQGAVLIISSG